MLLFNVIELLTHFGLIPLETEEMLSMALGIPMFGLSIDHHLVRLRRVRSHSCGPASRE